MTPNSAFLISEAGRGWVIGIPGDRSVFDLCDRLVNHEEWDENHSRGTIGCPRAPGRSRNGSAGRHRCRRPSHRSPAPRPQWPRRRSNSPLRGRFSAVSLFPKAWRKNSAASKSCPASSVTVLDLGGVERLPGEFGDGPRSRRRSWAFPGTAPLGQAVGACCRIQFDNRQTFNGDDRRNNCPSSLPAEPSPQCRQELIVVHLRDAASNAARSDQLALPMDGHVPVAGESCQHVVVSEVLRPRLHLLGR